MCTIYQFHFHIDVKAKIKLKNKKLFRIPKSFQLNQQFNLFIVILGRYLFGKSAL